MYSVQRDPPWVQQPARGSLAPSASVYSDDEAYEVAPGLLNHPDMPEIAPLRLHKKPSYHPSYHAHPDQHVKDSGPPLRQSRLPIFKQVRGLLQRPPPLDTATRNVKYDEFSGDISESGKAPGVKPSTYRNPYEGQFEVRRETRASRRHKARPQSGRSLSPVSVLNDREMEQIMSSPDLAWDNEVSPVDETAEDTRSRVLRTSHMSNNPKLPGTPPQQPPIQLIKRKPAPSRHSQSPENVRPGSSLHSSDYDGIPEIAQPVHTSHFSWTTYAPSIAPTATTFRTGNNPTPRDRNPLSDHVEPESRFSWSTVNTHMTAHARPDSPPPSPPHAAVPTKYKTPPVQSILSRHRPIQRMDREEWTPPARKTSLPETSANTTTSTPASTQNKLTITSQQVGSHGTGRKKQLPPPPELLTPVSPMSHLETLLREEQDKIHQRKNIEHAIADLTKLEKASPLEVSYAQVKDADRKLKELRTTLAEVQLEEREIGIAISRARRKEGEDEGLWVRRVTG